MTKAEFSRAAAGSVQHGGAIRATELNGFVHFATSSSEARYVLTRGRPVPGGGIVIHSGLKLGLTHGERRVFSRILLGETYREIAANLGCSVKNVEFHVSNILRRAHAPSMKKLVAEMGGGALG
jgi:DNA-binding CsgD family transcriptional regulator